ncbi:MAG: hypothetical protein IT455_05325 [Planctomycetes bacterium]|nr:hypothetical protein [Planctomycetota bacterium]
MLRSTVSALLVSATLVAATAAQSPITFGNLVVVRAGDGATSLSSAVAPVFLDEYTTAGTLVQSIALPTAPSGANRAFGGRGSGTSELYLNVSLDGRYLTLAGYDAVPGTPDPTSTLATTTARVIARVDFIGVVDTSTALSNAYSGGNIRAAISDDGNNFWTSGTALTEGGIRYAAGLGATTCMAISSGAPTNCRTIGAFDGQLYTSSASGTHLGVSSVGVGMPTMSGAPVDALPGFPTSGGTTVESAYDYFFADPTTLYVADDNTTAGDGGIQKWTFAGGTWSKQYTLKLNPTAGCRGLTGFVQDGVVTLWGTMNVNATGGNQTQLCTVVDTGPAAIVTSLVTSAASTAFRGVRYFGLPPTSQRITASCGTADIGVYGNAQIGTDVRTYVRNAVGIPLIGYGTIPLSVPFCGCTFTHDFLLLVGPAATHTLSLPNNPTLSGVLILVQGLDLLAPGGCPNLMFTLTDGYAFTLQ